MPDTPVKDLTNDELDRAGAVEVMGWKWSDLNWFWADPETGNHEANSNFSPSSNATDDNTILVHVRDNWCTESKDRFCEKLSEIWVGRALGSIAGNGDVCSVYFAIYYQPGDYVRSAVETAREAE